MIRSQGIGGLVSVAAVVLETDGSFSVIASQQVGDLTVLTGVVGSYRRRRRHPRQPLMSPVPSADSIAQRTDVSSEAFNAGGKEFGMPDVRQPEMRRSCEAGLVPERWFVVAPGLRPAGWRDGNAA